jgi:hypothetical protein
MNRIKSKDERTMIANATNPPPIPTTVVVGIVTPDFVGYWVSEWVGEGLEVVGVAEVDDIA